MMNNYEYEIAEAVRLGRIKRLYMEGHVVRKGYAVSLELQDAPPVRYYSDVKRARAVVSRFNRRFGQFAQ